MFEKLNYDPHIWPNMDYVRSLGGFDLISKHISRKEDLFFVHAVNMLNAVIREASRCKLYCIEDLGRTPESLVDFVDWASGEQLRPSVAWAEQSIQIDPVGSHNTRQLDFEPWHHEVLREIIRPEARAIYENCGYRFV